MNRNGYGAQSTLNRREWLDGCWMRQTRRQFLQQTLVGVAGMTAACAGTDQAVAA